MYALIDRTKPDARLAMFDFPNPNATSEQRMVTVGPMQRLYFMNNNFVSQQGEGACRATSDGGRRRRPDYVGVPVAVRARADRSLSFDSGSDFACRGRDAPGRSICRF